ncbi:tigger transposable element-derived protein 1-like [Macrobrachium rosenbergii]|uniref:tigger transposable element-derived protein 1-like n=1 Tax=Macrobrachium rosenbergii TaxID=79674 RepID=UPI0034D46C90
MTALLYSRSERYCRENNTLFKILLILDNAPGNPQHIGHTNENIKLVFLPPNTSLIPPMDQGAVATFKAYYLWNTFAQAVQATDNKEKDMRAFWKEFNGLNSIMNIGKMWKEVEKECMNGVWKNLLQAYVNSFKGFDKDEEEVVENNKKILTLGRILGLEIDEDIQELLDVELTAEDLIPLAEERKRAEEEEEIEEEPERKFMTKALAEVFASFEHGLKLLRVHYTSE